MTTPHEAAAKAVSGELPHLEPGVTNFDKRVATAAIEALREGAEQRALKAANDLDIDVDHFDISAFVDAILGPKAEA